MADDDYSWARTQIINGHKHLRPEEMVKLHHDDDPQPWCGAEVGSWLRPAREPVTFYIAGAAYFWAYSSYIRMELERV